MKIPKVNVEIPHVCTQNMYICTYKYDNRDGGMKELLNKWTDFTVDVFLLTEAPMTRL